MRNPASFSSKGSIQTPGTAQPFFPPNPAGISPLERLWNGFQIQTPNLSGIRIPEFREFFGVWNPQSWVLESGIQLKESRIPLTIGIQNPGSTEIQYLEYVVNGVEPPIQDCIGFQQ